MFCPRRGGGATGREKGLGFYISKRINEEFRCRTKTQASLSNEKAVLLLLFGVLRSGQIKLRRLVGWQELESRSKSARAA